MKEQQHPRARRAKDFQYFEDGNDRPRIEDKVLYQDKYAEIAVLETRARLKWSIMTALFSVGVGILGVSWVLIRNSRPTLEIEKLLAATQTQLAGTTKELVELRKKNADLENNLKVCRQNYSTGGNLNKKQNNKNQQDKTDVLPLD